MNVLDLSVFQNMRKCHAQVSRDHHGMNVMTEDQMWQAAYKAYKQLPSNKITSGFIKAYRLAGRIIKYKGDNSALVGSSSGNRTGVIDDFYSTDKGFTRKDDKIFPVALITYHYAEEEGGKTDEVDAVVKYDTSMLVAEGGLTDIQKVLCNLSILVKEEVGLVKEV